MTEKQLCQLSLDTHTSLLNNTLTVLMTLSQNQKLTDVHTVVSDLESIN